VRVRRRMWLAAGMVLTLAAGCGGGAAEEGGGDLIVGTTDDVVSLDPAKAYDYYSSNILFNAGDTLMGFEPGAEEASPQLAAEEPAISKDGLTYTFTLREGVTF
jgi:peptide/nickel transport system substrate-binding protein